MEILIKSSQAEPIIRDMGQTSWEALSLQQKRQVATRVYENDKSEYGKNIYALVSTGNPNANNFVYQVEDKPASHGIKPVHLLIAAGVLAIFALRD